MGYKFGVIGVLCKKQNKTVSLEVGFCFLLLLVFFFWLLGSEMKPLKEPEKICNSV